MGYLTSQQVADRVGVSVRRVRQIAEGLDIAKVGRDLLIDESMLPLFEQRKPVGRPRTRPAKAKVE